jgi:hypothetical protein
LSALATHHPRGIAATLLMGLVTILVGCGGGSSDSDNPQPQPQPLAAPQAKESFEKAEARFTKIVQSPHCEGLGDMLPVHRDVDASALCKTIQAQLEGAKVKAAEGYRGGGVIDFERDGKVIPAVLFLDQNGRFHFSYVDPFIDSKSAETKPTSAMDDAADEIVVAFASRDCDRVRAATDLQRGLGAAPQKTLCEYAKNNPIANIRGIDPQAEPRPLGGNAIFGFYGIGTSAVHYTMIVALRPGADPKGGGDPLSKYSYIDAFETNSKQPDANR